jgi:hypothetical protein
MYAGDVMEHIIRREVDKVLAEFYRLSHSTLESLLGQCSRETVCETVPNGIPTYRGHE